VLATQHLLDAAREFPGRRFVYASSSSIYGQSDVFPTAESALPAPHSPYGVTKLGAEHLCSLYHRNHGVSAVSLRYFSVFGPRQRPDMAFNRFCRAALLDEPVTVLGDGQQTRDFTYVSDIVDATRAAGTSAASPGRIYNIRGGSRMSLSSSLDLIAGMAGRELDIRHTEHEVGDVRDTGADIACARRDLGFRPHVSVRDGLAAEFEWMRELLAGSSGAG